MTKTSLPLWLISLSVVLLLFLPILIQDGMFSDAVLYTSVARNMAMGKGSFWFPYFDEFNTAHLPSFHEQPPLVFYLQSLFFRILGSSLYTERIYNLCTILLQMFLVHKIWKLLFKTATISNYSWMPVLFWMSIPISFWAGANGINENTMGVFCLLAVYRILRYFYQENKITDLFLSGMAVCASFLCKGFPGLYPLTVPIILLVIGKINWKESLRSYLYLMIPVIVFVLFVWFNEKAHRSIITYYLLERAFQRISNVPTVGNRTEILWRLISELLPLLGLTSILFFIRRRKIKTMTFHKKEILLLFLIGLSGTLPLMLTSVQKVFYMIAALPFFGLAFASFIAPLCVERINDWVHRYYKKFMLVGVLMGMFVVAFSLSFIGKTSRDQDLLYDVYRIKNCIPKGSYLKVAHATTFENWSLQNYLMRYAEIGLHLKGEPSRYLLVEKNQETKIPIGSKKLTANTKLYDVYTYSGD